jgi:hypothetical protein
MVCGWFISWKIHENPITMDDAGASKIAKLIYI